MSPKSLKGVLKSFLNLKKKTIYGKKIFISAFIYFYEHFYGQ